MAMCPCSAHVKVERVRGVESQCVLIIKVIPEELLAVLDSLLCMLGGADSPCPDATQHLYFGQLGTQTYLWVADRRRL